MRFPSSCRRFGALLLLLPAAGGPAAAAPQHCPETLSVEQRAVNLPTGLQAFDSETRHVWVNAQFSDGPPNEQAWLAPESSRTSGKTLTNLWRFVANQAGTWLSCGYTGTSIVASFRLPNTVGSCEVRYDTAVSPPAATTIDCR